VLPTIDASLEQAAMNLHALPARRAAEARRVRVLLVGAGKFGGAAPRDGADAPAAGSAGARAQPGDRS
jgi:hypothetical protein